MQSPLAIDDTLTRIMHVCSLQGTAHIVHACMRLNRQIEHKNVLPTIEEGHLDLIYKVLGTKIWCWHKQLSRIWGYYSIIEIK